MELALRELKKEINDKIDGILSRFKNDSSENIEPKNESDEEENKISKEPVQEKESIPEEFILVQDQLKLFKEFYHLRADADQLESSMGTLVNLQINGNVGNLVQNSITALSEEVVEKRINATEVKMEIMLSFSQQGCDLALEFFDYLNERGQSINDEELETEYRLWVLSNKVERDGSTPDRLEEEQEVLSETSTPKRYSSPESDNASNSRKRRIDSEPTSDDNVKTVLISPHPDFVSDDLPEIRIVTIHSQKIARSLNLISNEQRISLLAIDENSAVQVRTGCCYRIAAKIISLVI